jgi:hypothetical protein
MIVSIHQPSYWPWLGLLDKIAKSDLFILLDNVDVKRNSYQYRNLFYCEVKAKYLTLPVNKTSRENLNNLTFKNDDWRTEHLNKLKNYYSKAKYFDVLFKEIEALYSEQWYKPVDFILETMLFSLKYLNIKTEVRTASEFVTTGKKGRQILELCKNVNADVYLSGKGAVEYMQDVSDDYRKEGINILWQEFKHPEYKQMPEHSFVSGMACLDLFFFQGKEKSREIFWKNVQG